MKETNIAENLIEAFPYILKFRNKVFVIKFGGSISSLDEEKKAFIKDISLMKLLGMKIVIVHGGGKEISARLNKMGIKSEFKNGLRVTTDEAIEEVEMTLSKINSELTLAVNSQGVKAIGLNGKDGQLLKAKKKYSYYNSKKSDLGNVGDVEKVDVSLINLLIDKDYIPIVAPIGYDDEGNTLNINADSVASAIAECLQAEKLILLTDVKGVMRDKEDDKSLISVLDKVTIDNLINEGILQGGMIPKVQCAFDAIDNGVESVHIINGSVKHSLLLEVFTDKGIGTMIFKEADKDDNK